MEGLAACIALHKQPSWIGVSMTAGNLLFIALVFIVVFVISLDPIASAAAAVVIFVISWVIETLGDVMDR